MKNPHLVLFLITLFFAPHLHTISHAAVVPEVTINSVYSEFTGGTADRRWATNLVSDNGLFGDVHTTSPSGTMWLTLATTAGDFTNAFVTFDLGAVHTLDRMKVWNYNEGVSGANILTRRGIQAADISVAGEDLVFTTNIVNQSFDRAPGLFTNFGQTISMNGVAARYVRINVLNNFGEGDNRVGLSEVQFFDTNLPVRVDSASRNYSSNKVTVIFSESVTLSTATNPANYSIKTDGTNSATVLSAAMDLYNNRIALQTTPLANSSYTISVSNVVSAVDGTTTDGLPVPIESEVVLWLKADEGITADGSGLVSQWADQSGTGNNAAQSDPASQPTLVPGVLNGKPVIHFNSAATPPNHMLVPHADNLVLRSSDVSIFAVMNFESLNAFNTIIAKINTNTQPAAFDGYVRANGQVTFLRGNGWGNNTVNGATTERTVIPGEPVVLSFVVRGTNASQYFNGAFNNSVAAISGVGDVGAPVAIGGRTPAVSDFGTRLNGDIAEIMVVNGTISDSERIAIHDYLGSKYGISIINLLFTEQPQSVVKLEGQTASFNVSVTASSPEISYQWQRFGTNIPGATNASYTTPILTLADDNSPYRVQVSVPGSSQFSDVATLTVVTDQEQPTIVSAGRKIWNQSEITVVFSERVQASSATLDSNYTLDNGATVTSASVGESENKIELTTSGMVAGGTYSLTVQNVQDLFGNTIATVQVPVGVYPVPALWLSAGSGVTADGDGYILQWDDLSGNGNHAVALAGAPFTPQLIPNGYNNKPVARFDGVNSISLFAPSSESLAIVGDISIYSVAQFVDRSTHNAFVGKTTVNQPASYDFYLGANSGLPVFYRGNGISGTAVSVIGTTAPSLDVPHIVSAVMAGTRVNHYLDGITNGAGTLVTTMGDNGDGVGIGTRTDGATRMKGDVAEFIVFGSALSDSDRVALDAHFGALYGVPVGELPELTVVFSAGNIQLSWPDTAGFVLESSTLLVGGTWTPITTGIVTENGTSSIAIATTDAQQFFQLRKP